VDTHNVTEYEANPQNREGVKTGLFVTVVNTKRSSQKFTRLLAVNPGGHSRSGSRKTNWWPTNS